MVSELSNSAKRVQDFLSGMEFSFDVKELTLIDKGSLTNKIFWQDLYLTGIYEKLG
jgi:hypothetical protein